MENAGNLAQSDENFRTALRHDIGFRLITLTQRSLKRHAAISVTYCEKDRDVAPAAFRRSADHFD